MEKSIVKEYKVHLKRKIIVLLLFLFLVFAFVVLSVFVGSSNISFIQVIKALFGGGDATDRLIVWNIRMPRVLAAIIAGGGLAISGLVMQNVLKNPMASPSTLGVGNAAVFGANLAIVIIDGAAVYSTAQSSSLTINNPYLVTLFAFVFSVLSVFGILSISSIKKFGANTIILAGVALSAVFQAGTTIIQYFAADTQIASAVYWSFGDLSRATYTHDAIMAAVVVLSFLYFAFRRWDYAAMSGGRKLAVSLGVKIKSTTVISLMLASLITAVCVSFLGIIGFVGLIAPQIVKRIIGDDYRYLLPISFLCGSLVLLVSDTIGRVLISGISLPVGAITALLGGPVFICVLLRGKEKHES